MKRKFLRNTDTSTSVEQQPIEQSNGDLANPDDQDMNILIRFVNEKEMKIKAKPTDTILLLKR